ncbi:S-layer protein [Cytobacillus firmus]|uniref:S-layer protein n=1 Tax=Cytobacillus firmus TaxID=1399 RepID=UPI003685A51A
MAKKKAIKLAAASAVAASAFVAAAPAQTDAASNVAVEVSKAVTQMKKAYHTYSDVTANGEFAPIADVYKEYNAAKKAYANAKALVNKAGGADKDKHLAALEDTYADFIAKRVITYIDAYNYATTLQDKQFALEDALKDKDWDAAEEQYHAISYELKTRTVILDRVYGKTTRELLRGSFKADAQAARDSIQNEVTVKIYFDKAEGLLAEGKLEEAKAAMDHVADYVAKLDKDTDFGAALLKKVEAAKEKYEELSVPAVKSVSAINNKEVLVTFNKAVNEDLVEDIANYTLKAVTTGGAATLSSAELQADGKSVLVTLGTQAANQDVYKLTLKNIKDANGTAVATTEKEVKFFDAVAPTVDNVSVVAPRTVKLNFSEPLASAPAVKLDNGSISTTVTLSADKKSATVEFGIEPTVGSHELEIQGGADYASLKVEKVVKSFLYQKDEAAPTVSVDKADAKTVTLKFSKPVAVKNAGDVSVYHTINNSGAYAGGALTPVSAVNGFADTFTVTFNTPIPEGAVKVFLNTKANALEDGWGNDVASAELSSSVVVDKTAPAITGVKAVTDKKLEVTFSEDVNSTDAQKLSNYILKDASGKVLSDKDYSFVNNKGEFLNSVTVSYSQKKATITLPSSLQGGNYTLTVKEIKDVSFLENKLISQDTTVAVSDTTAWDITSNALRSTDNKKIRITFNETMSTEGLADLSKYELRNGSGAKVAFPTDTKVVVLSPKAVEIQLGAAEATATNVRVAGTLKDAAGNTFTELFKQVAISAEAGPGLVADTAKTTATDKVEFQVNQELSGSLNPAQFTTAGVTYGGASYVNKDGKSTITLTLSASSDKFASSATPAVAVASGALTSIYGASNTSGLNVSVADGVAPSVKKDSADKLVITNTANTDNIAIQFTENLDATNQALVATDLVITDNTGKSLVAGVDFTTTVATDTITVDLAGNYNGYAGKVTVASKDKPVYIKDAATVGNAANSFAATEVTVGDSTAPTAPAVAKLSITDSTNPAKDTLTGTAGAVEGLSTVKVYSDAALTTLVGQGTALADGSFAAIDLTAEATGTINYYVVSVDAAGNVSSSTTVSYTAAQ